MKSNNIGITSIGLDGEKIDQVTFMDKPRIFAKKGYIIATAETTVKSFDAEYKVLEKTSIFTSIGNIIILRITKAGNVLIAGPSIISDMEYLIDLLDKYNLKTIFIDGAFFRHSLAKVAKATILVVGANLNSSIDLVVNDAVVNCKKFMLKEVKNSLKTLKNYKNICLVNKYDEIRELSFDTVIGNTAKIFDEYDENIQYLYLPKALTNDFLLQLIDRRKTFLANIVIDNPINIQLNIDNMSNLFKLNNEIFVLNTINLKAICYNPVSPKGYKFNNLVFKKKLEESLGMQVYNVVEEKSKNG